MTTYAGPQPGTFLWIALNGNNATAQRGRIDRPFATIQAALTAAQDNDTLFVAPGEYFESLTIPDKSGLAIVGENNTTTIITTGGGASISWTPLIGAVITSFRLSQLTINNSDALSDAIMLDGSAITNPNTFLNVCTFDNLVVNKTNGGQALRATCVGRIITVLCNFDSTVSGLGVRLRNVSRFGSTSCSFSAQAGTFAVPGLPLTALDLGFDRSAAAPVPGLGREGYYLSNASLVVTNTVLSGQPIFQVDSTSTLYGTLTATALVFFAGGPLQGPILNLHGTFGGQIESPAGSGYLTPPVPGVGTITITMPSNATAGVGGPRQILNMTGKFWGTITISKPVGAPNLRQAVNAKGCIIYPAAAGGISAGSLIDLDLRGASFAQAALAVSGGGTIDRNTHTIPTIVAPALIPAFPAFPAGATYTIAVEPVGVVAGLTASVSAKTTTGFTYIASLAGTTLGFTLQRNG